MSDETPTKYRLSFWPCYGISLAWGYAFMAIFFLIMWLADYPPISILSLHARFTMYSLGALGLAVIALPIVAVLILWLEPAYEVSSDGVRGSGGLKKNVFFSWSSMISAKRAWPFGYPVVLVRSENEKGPMSIPLLQRGQKDFEATVERLAPEDNALRKFFRDRKA